jgi:hypothetical protein
MVLQRRFRHIARVRLWRVFDSLVNMSAGVWMAVAERLRRMSDFDALSRVCPDVQRNERQRQMQQNSAVFRQRCNPPMAVHPKVREVLTKYDVPLEVQYNLRGLMPHEYGWLTSNDYVALIPYHLVPVVSMALWQLSIVAASHFV